MRCAVYCAQLLGGLLLAGSGIRAAVVENRDVYDSLRHRLSPGATISHDPTTAQRWSDYHGPQVGTIVGVKTEHDVQATNKRPFMAQSGGHGWQDSFNLDQNGILINMRGLNTTTVSQDKKTARIGGGSIVQEVIEAAYANNVRVLTGNCNCVGVLGAGLGGGYGNLMGLYGFSIDNMLSLNVVLADGSFVTVTPKDSDLWWALHGAGPNFGIVTSALYKAYSAPKAQNTAYQGSLFFTQDKLEQVVQAVEDIKLKANMNVFMYFVTSGAPDYTPSVMITPFFLGSEADGRAAFASFFAIGPVGDTTKELSYTSWNAGADGFCTKGGRKPVWAAGFDRMDGATWREIWNQYTQLVATPGAGNSALVVEVYSLKNANTHATDASFPNRDVRYNTAIIPIYTDPSLDAQAAAFGTYARALLQTNDGYGYQGNRTYINFAHGDESNQEVYGKNTARLRQLKRKYDPHNVFSHWFDLA